MKRQNFYLSLSLFYFLFLSTSMFFVFTRLPPFKSEDQIFDKFEKFCAFERTRVVTNQITIPSHTRSCFDRMISLD